MKKLNTAYIKYTAGLVASLLIGITFIVSGTGKIIGLEETPGQVIDFLSCIIPDIFLTPAIIYFIYKIFIPYIIPWIELLLGIFLVTGFAPRLMAIICLPLILAFMGTNIWSMVQGGYATCADCFGFWENIFGSMTPLQSLIYDIVLLALSLTVIFVHPGGILSSREDIYNSTGRFKSAIKSWLPSAKSFILKYRNIIIGAVTVIVVILLVISGMNIFGQKAPEIKVGNITVSEISRDGAVISWITDEPAISRILLYDSGGTYFREITDIRPVTEHQIALAGLYEKTGYYFAISISPRELPEDLLTQANYFETAEAIVATVLVSNIHINLNEDSSLQITWKTDSAVAYTLEYWPVNSPETVRKVNSSDMQMEHSSVLYDLLPDLVYSMRLTSTDAEGNQSVSEYNNYFSLATGIEEGMRAPDFTLNNLSGESVTLNELHGKAVLLDFWSWTCSACKIKLPMIQDIQNLITNDKLAVLAIHYEGRTAAIESFLISEKYSFPVLMDEDGSVNDLYGVTGFPSVFIIDEDGFVRKKNPVFTNVQELKIMIDAIISND